jgi:BirA family biotin operon repressor/biotin-[acetyl-CoA-carboxylase] ligase
MIEAGKGEPVLPPPFRLIAHDTLSSTNDEARRLAEGGAEHGLVVTARSQTAGRGRRGRRWESPPGNLHCSLLLRPAKPLGEAAQLSFVAGVALCDALRGLASNLDIACKWPNDVLCQGRKVAGMLLEGADGAVILGLGVDVVEAHAETLHPAVSLRQAGVATTAEAVLARFVTTFSPWYDRWMEAGMAAIGPAWLERARGVGGEILVRLDGETLTGIFTGLDGQGALLLALPGGGTRRILAGDVFFA